MRRQLGLLLALALAASGVSAHAAPRTAARQAAAFARWSQRRDLFAKHLPLDPAVRPSVIVGSGADEARLVRGGDLDRDGTVDLIDIRSHETYNPTTDEVTQTMRLEAHRGRDGKQLWSISLGTAYYVFPIVTSVGTGVPGVVVVQYGDQSVDGLVAGAGETAATVTAYDGAGKQVWTRALNGAWAGSLLTDQEVQPFVTGVFDAIAGGGSEVLVEYGAFTGLYGGPAYTSTGTAQLVVLDGTTGTPRPFGGPMVSTGWPAEVSTVPDLDGDKLDDAVAVTSDGNKTVAYGISGAKGNPLWVTPTLPDADDSFAVPAGDVTGDGVGDILVSHDSWSGVPIIGDYVGGKVTLLDGKTGVVKWTKAGAFGYALGNVDGASGAEIAVVDWVEDAGVYGFSVTAFDGSGTQRWAMRRTLASTGGSEAIDVEVGLVGDIEPDGAADLGYFIGVTPMKEDGDGGKARTEGGTVSGRTGRVLRDPVPGFYAIGVSFDGHGDDAYTRELKHGLLTVTAWRGDGKGKLWRTAVKAAGSTNGSLGASLDRDKCADLVVSTRNANATTDYAFSGATGLPLWSLARVGDAAAVVKQVAPATHRDYAQTC